MTEIPINKDYWEVHAGRIVEQGLGPEDLEYLIELGLTKVTEAPTDEVVMGSAKKRKKEIFRYLEGELAVTSDELMTIEDKNKPTRLASSEILVRIIAACHAFEAASRLPEADVAGLKEEIVEVLRLDLLPRIWKGATRQEVVTVEGEEESIYHFCRGYGLVPVAGAKYLPEPERKLPALIRLLESKITVKTTES